MIFLFIYLNFYHTSNFKESTFIACNLQTIFFFWVLFKTKDKNMWVPQRSVLSWGLNKFACEFFPVNWSTCLHRNRSCLFKEWLTKAISSSYCVLLSISFHLAFRMDFVRKSSINKLKSYYTRFLILVFIIRHRRYVNDFY